MLCDMSTSDASLILTIRIIEFRALVWYATDQLPIIDISTSAVSNKKNRPLSIIFPKDVC